MLRFEDITFEEYRGRASRTPSYGRCSGDVAVMYRDRPELRVDGVLRSSHLASVGGIMLTMERVRTRLREAGWKGDNKDEFEPVRASRRILRRPQRGQPPARRDVRWPWPSTGEQGGSGERRVGTLSGRASKGWGPCG